MLKALSLAAALAAAPAAAFEIDAMSPAERDAFGAAVRDYLMENPQVLMEAVGALEERQAAEQSAGDAETIAANRAALTEDGHSWIGGDPNGDVTVVEFLDYRCGYCRRAHPEVTELIESDGGIRLVVKEFPILGDQSLLASRFAMAVQRVAGDDIYREVNNALMTMRADVTERSLGDLADGMGLETETIMAAMSDPEIDRRIEANHALGRTLGINGTPSFVVGDQMVRGYVPLDAMREIVAAERSEG